MQTSKLFIYALIAVLTGVLALLDPRTAVVFGCFCVTFAILCIDEAEKPSVHDRVRANRAQRRANRVQR